MIKKIIGILLISIPVMLHAQLSVNVQLPPAGLIQKEQLWNLVLSNNSNTTLDVAILITLQDAVTGQTVLSGSSRSIAIPRGIKTINSKDVQPVQYNYGLSAITGSYLPLGSYIACYTITKLNHQLVETLTNECVNINISPLSPPLLNMPADKSLLQTRYPQFSWTPPTPLPMFDNLNYEVVVAELQEGQSPADAIRTNTPVYLKTNSKQTFENYPSTYARLDSSKTYAWQVIARNGFYYSVPTEVWTFSFAKDSVKLQNIGSTYILLKANADEAGINYIEGAYLFLKYYSFDKEHAATVRFFNSNGGLIKQQKQKIIYGDNFMRFELNRQFRHDQVYRVEITDQQNRIHTASFIVK
jgi:hypothetical protein